MIHKDVMGANLDIFGWQGNVPARRQGRRGWPLVEGASPRPEKRVDIAKNAAARQRRRRTYLQVVDR